VCIYILREVHEWNGTSRRLSWVGNKRKSGNTNEENEEEGWATLLSPAVSFDLAIMSSLRWNFSS
jgi:hypothetical protein